MTDRIKEQLSAFLDGELPDPESALLLKRLERDDELRGALSRYSLIGAVLRNDGDVPAARQVAARVSAAIAREPARGAGRLRLRAAQWRSLRAAAGIAVAAGVALGAVLLVQQVGSQDPGAPDAVMARAELPPVQPVVDDVDAFDGPAEIYVTPPAPDARVGHPARGARQLPGRALRLRFAARAPQRRRWPHQRRRAGARGRLAARGDGRAVTSRPAIAIALGLAATPAFAESGQEWLARMGAALSNASYIGEFVSESAGRTERFAITHRVRDGVVSERLVSLSGHGRELVRENDEVVVYLPDQKLAIIERRSGRSDLLGALPQFEGRMASWYKVDWVGRETLDDFGPTAVVAVRPLDGYRFGYRLWIDVDSHMPVRSDLSDGSGRVIERLRFTKLKFDNGIPDSAFEPALDRRKLRWVRQSPQADEEAPAWRAAQVPPGFRLSASGVQALAGPEHAGRRTSSIPTGSRRYPSSSACRVRARCRRKARAARASRPHTRRSWTATRSPPSAKCRRAR